VIDEQERRRKGYSRNKLLLSNHLVCTSLLYVDLCETCEQPPSVQGSLGRAPNDLEVLLALVADGVGWAASSGLIGTSPGFGEGAAARGADLGLALRRGRVGSDTLILSSTHDGQVVRGTGHLEVSGVAELEQCLGLPLGVGALISCGREAHADFGERSLNDGRAVGLDLDGAGHCGHLKSG